MIGFRVAAGLANDVAGAGFEMLAQGNEMLVVRGFDDGLVELIIFFVTQAVAGDGIFHADQRAFNMAIYNSGANKPVER